MSDSGLTLFSEIMLTWVASYLLISSVFLTIALISFRLSSRYLPEKFKNNFSRWLVIASILVPFLMMPSMESHSETTNPVVNISALQTQSNESFAANQLKGVADVLDHSVLKGFQISAPWATSMVILWILISFTLLTRYLFQWKKFKSRYSEREEISLPEHRFLIEQVATAFNLKRTLRLTYSSNLSSPVAIGYREVCLPKQLIELESEKLQAVIAHELMHLKRFDNLWLIFSRLTKIIMFFQPLNALVTNRIECSNEFICDSAAVGFSKSPVPLMQALIDASKHSHHFHHSNMVSCAVSNTPSLSERVERITQEVNSMKYFKIIFSAIVVCGLAVISTSAPVLAVMIEQTKSGLNKVINVDLPNSVQIESVEKFHDFQKLKGYSENLPSLTQTMKQLQTLGEPVMKLVEKRDSGHYFEIDLFEKGRASNAVTNIKSNYPDFVSSFKHFNFEAHKSISSIESKYLEHEILVTGNARTARDVTALLKSLSDISNVNLKNMEKQIDGYRFLISVAE